MKAREDSLTPMYPLALWLLALIAAAGVGVVLWLTRHGTGLDGDSFQYLEGARNIVEGHGYSCPSGEITLPITNWPPLFSCLLAAGSFFGVEPWTAARWLNAFLVGVNIFLTGYIALRQAKPHWIAALCVAVFLLGSWQFLLLHSLAMSEPLFLTLSLFGILFLLRYCEAPSWRGLLLAASFFALSLLTRLFAIPLLAAGILCVLFSRGGLRTRLLHAVVFGIASSSLFFCFLLRNQIVTGRIFGSMPRAAVISPEVVHNLLSIFPLWSWPVWIGFSWLTKVVVFSGSAGLLVVFLAAAGQPRPSLARDGLSLTHVLGLFLGGYLLFYFTVALPAAYSIGEWGTMNRYLSPMIPLLMLLFAHVLGQSPAGRRWRIASAVFGIMTTLGCLKIGLAWVRGVERDGGIAYSKKMWRESETLRFIRGVPPGKKLYSNEPLMVLHYARKTANDLPWMFSYITGTRTSPGGYNTMMANLQRNLEQSGAWVVYFTQSEQTYHVSLAALTNSLPLETVASFHDGVVSRLSERRERAVQPD
jgi:hypothetical protein